MTHNTSSFADRDASRKRMGLSQHVLTLIERSGGSGANFVSTSGQSRNTATGGGDSSETEEQCRQRCEWNTNFGSWNLVQDMLTLMKKKA